MILRKFNMFFFSTLRDRSNPTFGKQRLKYPSMGRNRKFHLTFEPQSQWISVIKKTLISANIFMIGLCLYAWSIDKPYSGKVDFIEPSKNLPPLQVFEHQRNIFKSIKKSPSKNFITQVKVFPRGGECCSRFSRSKGWWLQVMTWNSITFHGWFHPPKCILVSATSNLINASLCRISVTVQVRLSWISQWNWSLQDSEIWCSNTRPFGLWPNPTMPP